MAIELARGRLEQRAVQPALHQRGAKPHEGRALGRRLVRREATEPPKARPIVERLRQADIRQIVPGRQQQRAEQRQGRPARLAPGRRRDARQQTIQLGPVDHRSDHVERRAAPRRGATQRQLNLTNAASCHDRLQQARHDIESEHTASDQAIRAQVS